LTEKSFNAGFVTGLMAEASLLDRYHVLCQAGGGDAAGARNAAIALRDAGATALISFGLAGGLDHSLPPGTVLRPRRVIDAEAEFPADPALLDALGGANCEAMLAGERIATSRAEKSALFAASGASAIDLESGAVAAAATAAGLPFAALRAIADPAWRDLPAIVETALDNAGRIRLGAILRHTFHHPGTIPALVALGRDAAAARRNLRQALSRCDWSRLRAA